MSLLNFTCTKICTFYYQFWLSILFFSLFYTFIRNNVLNLVKSKKNKDTCHRRLSGIGTIVATLGVKIFFSCSRQKMFSSIFLQEILRILKIPSEQQEVLLNNLLGSSDFAQIYIYFKITDAQCCSVA